MRKDERLRDRERERERERTISRGNDMRKYLYQGKH